MMSSKNSDTITVIQTESALTCQERGSGVRKGEDGGNSRNSSRISGSRNSGSRNSSSGVISVMKRPSSWPNLLSDYWFNATNCNYSLESPLKTTTASQSPSSQLSSITLRQNVDTSGEKQSPSSLHAGSRDEGSHQVDSEGEEDSEEEDDSKCVVIIGRNHRRDNLNGVMERSGRFYDEIQFLDEDTQSILLSPQPFSDTQSILLSPQSIPLSPQPFSHSSILNPSPENSPTSDDEHQRDGNRGSTKEPKPHFPIGEFDFLECEICLRKQWLYRRPCCSFPACPDCLKAYFTTKIEQSIVTVECINNFCSSFVHRDEISTRLDQNMKTIYYRLLLSSNSNGLSKTCPQCNHVKTLESMDQLKRMRKAAKKDPRAACVICDQCHYLWCFPCCSPWHEGIKCRQYIQGDLLLHLWAKQMNQGQFNAQKCPKCKIFIQRSSGCDHMHCSRCKTDFCYRCGDQLRRLKFFGDHYSKLSIFGCKYRYKASQPVQRKLIRAAVFGSKVLLAPVIGSLAVAAGAMVLGLGVAALPLYGGIRFYRKYQSQKFTSHLPPPSKSFTSKDVAVQTTVTTVTYFDENGSRLDVNILERNDSSNEEDIYGSIFDGRLFDSDIDENGILDSSSYEYNHGIHLPGNNSSSHVRILEDGEDFQDMYPDPISGEEGNYLQFYRSSNKTVSL